MKILYKPIFAAFTLSLALPLSAQENIGLQELIQEALAKDANLNQQKIEHKYTALDQEKLRDIFLPKLEVKGKYGYMYSSVNLTTPDLALPPIKPIFPGMKIHGENKTINVSGWNGLASAEASMLIYSGGKVKYLKQALQEKSLSENILLDKNTDEVISNISKIYDQFALVHESKNVLDESEKRLKANKNLGSKALGYGLITPYDFKKIELAEATLESKIVEYEGKKDLLITQLHLLTGISKERLQNINPKLSPIDYQLQDDFVENRAEIQALEHGIKASEYKIKAEQQWWQPKVQAVSSLSYIGLFDNLIYSSQNLLPIVPKRLNFSPNDVNVFPMFQAGIAFKWDIFDGNEGKAAVEKAKIDKEVLENKKKDALDKLKLNLANVQNNYNIANAQISLKLKAREIAKSAVKQVEKEFRYGTKKSVDLIEAENDLENTELEYQTAIFNQRRAAIELMRATKKLNISLL